MMFSNCPASYFCCLLFPENQVEVRVYDPTYCSMLVMAIEKTLTYTTRILTCTTSTCSEYTFRSFLSDANEKTDYLHYMYIPLPYTNVQYLQPTNLKKNRDLVISRLNVGT